MFSQSLCLSNYILAISLSNSGEGQQDVDAEEALARVQEAVRLGHYCRCTQTDNNYSYLKTSDQSWSRLRTIEEAAGASPSPQTTKSRK
jgi:hypothetical protein